MNNLKAKGVPGEPTPRPWQTSGIRRRIINGQPFLTIDGPNGVVAYIPSHADQRLIAAAPDMLAELRACPCPHRCLGGVDLTVEQCMARGECGCSRGAVITKATGEGQT